MDRSKRCMIVLWLQATMERLDIALPRDTAASLDTQSIFGPLVIAWTENVKVCVSPCNARSAGIWLFAVPSAYTACQHTPSMALQLMTDCEVVLLYRMSWYSSAGTWSRSLMGAHKKKSCMQPRSSAAMVSYTSRPAAAPPMRHRVVHHS